MQRNTQQSNLVKQILTEYPTCGSLTLAKRLHRDHADVFPSVEHARMVVRYYRGEHGAAGRKKLTDATHVKDMDKYLRDKFALPEGAVMRREPYVLPKVNDKIIVFGDCHFPYQNNEGIYAALEYGAKKSVNCFILNGDMLDMYMVSRFSKDGRKPQVDYEIELYYEFLLNLRSAFPDALIVWKYGNHEERWDYYMKAMAPMLYMTGTDTLEDTMPLGDLNVIVVKDKRRILAGDLNVMHGHEFGGGSGTVNPARTMSLKSKANTLVNHFHRSSSHKERDLNGAMTRYYSLGSMCKPQDYAPYGNQDCSFGWLRVINGVCYVQDREV